VERSRKVAGRLNGGVGFLMKKKQDRRNLGRGNHRSFRQALRQSLEKRAPKGALPPGAYQAKHIIVATGARPRVLPGLEPDKQLV